MLPQRKKAAGIIVSNLLGGQVHGENAEATTAKPTLGLEAHGAAVLAALEAKDPKGLALALQALYQACDSDDQ